MIYLLKILLGTLTILKCYYVNDARGFQSCPSKLACQAYANSKGWEGDLGRKVKKFAKPPCWGVLSPLAKCRGWAPGPVTDWQHGSQGWIVWVALGAMLGDSAVGIAWLILELSVATVQTRANFNARVLPGSIPRSSRPTAIDSEGSNPPVGQENRGRGTSETAALLTKRSQSLPSESPRAMLEREASGTTLSNRTVTLYLILAFLLCLGTTMYLFKDRLSTWQVSLAVALIAPLGIGSIRAMGETDNSLASTLSKRCTFDTVIQVADPDV